MEFFIRKDSTEPILKMQLIQDGRNDFKSFFRNLENAIISFSMKKVNTGEFVILNSAGGIVQKTEIYEQLEPEYYIYYRFTESQTSEVGRFQGQFLIELLDTSQQLVVPIREDLFINIQPSFGVF